MFTKHDDAPKGMQFGPSRQRILLARLNEIRRTVEAAMEAMTDLESEIQTGHVADDVDGPYDESWRNAREPRRHLTPVGRIELARRFGLGHTDERLSYLFGLDISTVRNKRREWEASRTIDDQSVDE